MKLLHFSDNHGNLNWLNHVDMSDVDIIVTTGDFFPNCSRGNVEKEIPFQKYWLDKNVEGFKSILDGRPLVIVPGNHDFVCLFG